LICRDCSYLTDPGLGNDLRLQLVTSLINPGFLILMPVEYEAANDQTNDHQCNDPVQNTLLHR
jgi:hypothetical protein